MPSSGNSDAVPFYPLAATRSAARATEPGPSNWAFVGGLVRWVILGALVLTQLLDDRYATKADIDRLERKLDALVAATAER